MADIVLKLLLPMGLTGSLLYLLTLFAGPLWDRLQAYQRKHTLLAAAVLFVLPLPLLFMLAQPVPSGDLQQPNTTRAMVDTLRTTPAIAPAYKAGENLRTALETFGAPTGKPAAVLPDSNIQATGNVVMSAADTAPLDERNASAALTIAPTESNNRLAGFSLPALSLSQWIATVYSIGFGIALLLSLLRYGFFVRQLSKACQPIQSSDMLQLYTALCKEMKIRRLPSLYESNAVSAPFLYGAFRARVVLPSHKADSAQLTYALRHELTHYRLGDVRLKLFVLLVSAVHWYNPLAHLLVRSFDAATEMRCDEVVIQSLGGQGQHDYANALLAFAEPAIRPMPTSAFAAPARQLKRRLLRLIKPASTSRRLRCAATSCISMVLILCTLVGCGFAAGTSIVQAIPETLTSNLGAIDLYHISYNVNYEGMGTELIPNQIVSSKKWVTVRNVIPTRPNYYFDGWNMAPDGSGTTYRGGALLYIKSDTTLFAQWKRNQTRVAGTVDIPLPAAAGTGRTWWAKDFDTLEAALKDPTLADGDVIELTVNTISMTRQLHFPPKVLTLRSKEGLQSTLLRMPGNTSSMVIMDSGATLLLENVILDGNGYDAVKNPTGIQKNSGCLLYVEGTLFLQEGAILQNNITTPAKHAVYLCAGIYNRGTVMMTGGEIRNNQVIGYSIGVGVGNHGTFIMNGGAIKDNTGWDGGSGIGIYNSANFCMGGGAITGNTCSSEIDGLKSWGGGVYNQGAFSMTGGTIGGTNPDESNFASEGSGVYNASSSRSFAGFTNNGGTIFDKITDEVITM